MNIANVNLVGIDKISVLKYFPKSRDTMVIIINHVLTGEVPV